MRKTLLLLAVLFASVIPAIAATVGDKYEKVLSTADLTTGDEYILCYETNAMGALNGKYYNPVTNGITLSSNTATIASADVNTFTLEAGSVDNSFAFKMANGKYLQCTNTSNGNLSETESLAANCNLKITIANGVATIIPNNQNNNNSNKIQYNSNKGQERFTNYKTGTQKDCSLYKKVVEESNVATPVIACENNTVTITAEDADAIYYTTNGDNPTAESTKYEAPFAITANTTVKAIAVKGEELSNVASYNAIFEGTYASFAEFFAAGKDAVGTVTGPITAFFSSGNYMYVKDAANGFALLFGIETPVTNGDTYEAIKGTVGEFGNNPQLINYTLGSKTTGDALEPETATIADLKDFANCAYIKLENVELSASEIKQNSNTIDLFNRFTIDIPTNYTKTYNIVGVYTSYNGTPQVQPISIEEVVVEIPVVKPEIPVLRNVEVDEDGIAYVYYNDVIEIFAENATSITIGDETQEGNTFNYTVTATDEITVVAHNGDLSSEASFEIFLNDPTITVNFGETVLTEEGEATVTEGTKIELAGRGVKEFSAKFNDEPIALTNNAFTITESGLYEFIASNGESNTTIIVEFTVEEAQTVDCTAEFDFVNNSYGMTLKSGSDVSYESTVNTIYANHVAVHFNGDHRRYNSTKGVDCRIKKNSSFTVSVPEDCYIKTITVTSNSALVKSSSNLLIVDTPTTGTTQTLENSNLTTIFTCEENANINTITLKENNSGTLSFTTIVVEYVADKSVEEIVPEAAVEPEITVSEENNIFSVSVPEGHKILYKATIVEKQTEMARAASMPNTDGHKELTGTEISKNALLLENTLDEIPEGSELVVSLHSVNAHGQISPEKTVKFLNDGEFSGIADINAENNGEVEYFNLQGVRVAEPTNGLYLRRQGGKVEKVVIR